MTWWLLGGLFAVFALLAVYSQNWKRRWLERKDDERADKRADRLVAEVRRERAENPRPPA